MVHAFPLFTLIQSQTLNYTLKKVSCVTVLSMQVAHLFVFPILFYFIYIIICTLLEYIHACGQIKSICQHFDSQNPTLGDKKFSNLLILWTEPLSVTIHWKAVEQYFTVVLFVNPLTPRVKPWVIQSFLTFDSKDRTLKCAHSFESC